MNPRSKKFLNFTFFSLLCIFAAPHLSATNYWNQFLEAAGVREPEHLSRLYCYGHTHKTVEILHSYESLKKLMDTLKEIKRFKPDTKSLDLSWSLSDVVAVEGYSKKEFFEELSREFKDLEYLNLSGWVVDASMLGCMPSLKTLVLRYSTLTRMTQDTLPALEELDLCSSNCPFDSAILSLPPNLKRLHLETISLSDASQEKIQELNNLEELSLSHCPGVNISILGNALLTSWPEIKILNIGTAHYKGHNPSMEEIKATHEQLNRLRPTLKLSAKRDVFDDPPQTKPAVPIVPEDTEHRTLGTPEVVVNITEEYVDNNAQHGCFGFFRYCAISYPFDIANFHLEQRHDTPRLDAFQKFLDDTKQSFQVKFGFIPSPDRIED